MIIGWGLAASLLLILEGIIGFFCVLGADEELSINQRWVLMIVSIIAIVVGFGCGVATSPTTMYHPERLTDDELRVVREYRIHKQQQALAKELAELKKGEQKNAEEKAVL
jgi:hypothetical protein